MWADVDDPELSFDAGLRPGHLVLKYHMASTKPWTGSCPMSTHVPVTPEGQGLDPNVPLIRDP
jgi:hypothetical protein